MRTALDSSLRSTEALKPKPPPAPPAPPPVKPKDIPRAEWNMFVHLNADNNLESFGKGDLNEMEKVGSIKGKMNVFALVDGASGYQASGGGWTEGTRLMWIQRDPKNSAKIVSRPVWVDPKSELGQLLAKGKGELNMGNPKVLNAALKYVQEKIPAKKTMVDLWDHGDGWKSCSYDEQGGEMIPVRGDLKKAFEGVKVDVVGFDECLMSTKEIADIAKAAGAQYLVASEHTEPGAGWNYGDLLTRYKNLFGQGQPVTAEQLAKAAVRSYAAGGAANSNMNATDLSKLPALNEKLDALADAIKAAGGFKNEVVKAALGKVHRADYDGDQADIGHLAKLIAEGAPAGALKDAAVALQATVAEVNFNRAPAGGIAKDSTGLTVYCPQSGAAVEYVKNKDNPWVGTKWTQLVTSETGFTTQHAPRANYPWPSRAAHSNEWFRS